MFRRRTSCFKPFVIIAPLELTHPMLSLFSLVRAGSSSLRPAKSENSLATFEIYLVPAHRLNSVEDPSTIHSINTFSSPNDALLSCFPNRSFTLPLLSGPRIFLIRRRASVSFFNVNRTRLGCTDGLFNNADLTASTTLRYPDCFSCVVSFGVNGVPFTKGSVTLGPDLL